LFSQWQCKIIEGHGGFRQIQRPFCVVFGWLCLVAALFAIVQEVSESFGKYINLSYVNLGLSEPFFHHPKG
jgi:hypothetical protein